MPPRSIFWRWIAALNSAASSSALSRWRVYRVLQASQSCRAVARSPATTTVDAINTIASNGGGKKPVIRAAIWPGSSAGGGTNGPVARQSQSKNITGPGMSSANSPKRVFSRCPHSPARPAMIRNGGQPCSAIDSAIARAIPRCRSPVAAVRICMLNTDLRRSHVIRAAHLRMHPAHSDDCYILICRVAIRFSVKVSDAS